MIKKQLEVLPQYLAPQRALTAIAGWFGECRWVWLKNYLIHYFITRYDIDVDAALSARIEDYPNFNSFFTRQLKPELRPITQEPHAIASPVDGCVSQIGSIEDHSLLQAKGVHFDLTTLLGGFEQHAQPFRGGNFATLYLAPKDYHRVHMPLTGQLCETIYIPGSLFSVNQKTTLAVPHLFARNERLVCLFETTIGPMAIILVGAMLVGSINTVWGQTPPFARKIVTQSYKSDGITLEHGAELGHFKMGSTVIILFPKNKITWRQDIFENSIVQYGQLLGNICCS